ncbi:MAG: DEAD/DEAH box helicase [Actinomycetota bacterium]
MFEACGRVSAAARAPEIIEDFPSLRGADFYLVHDEPGPFFFVALDRDDSPPPRVLMEAIRAAETGEDEPPREKARASSRRGRPVRDGATHEGVATTTSPSNAPPHPGDGPAPGDRRAHAPRPSRRKLPVIDGGGLRQASREGIRLECAPVLDFFLALPLETDLARHSVSSRALCAAGAIALSLAMTSSFIPEVVPGWDGAFTVRYLPLAQGEKVWRALAWLEEVLPANLGYRRRGQAVYAPGAASRLVALFLDRIVARFAHAPADLVRDKLTNAFFAGGTYEPTRFEERRTVASISNWLERLAMRGKAVSPVVRIETPAKDLFGLHLDVEDRDDPLAPILSLSEVFASEDEVFSRPARRVRHDLARQIAVAGEYLPQLLDILDSRGVMSAAVSPVEMADLLTRHATVLGILGIRMVLPRELAKLLSPKLALRASLSGSARTKNYLSLAEMLEFDWEISLGETVMTREEFLELVRSAQGVVRFRDGYVMLSPDEAERMLRQMSKPPPTPSSMELLRWALAGEERGMELHTDAALARWLKRMAKPERIDVPATLTGSLRPYQERGLGWLYTNAARGIGSCLADDMGLGKTIQAIALVLALKERKAGKHPALVVCPTTVVGNWRKEVERFTPSLRVSIYHGAERRLATKDRDLVITSYGILRRDLDKFKARAWGPLIIDEAQNIKNPRTDQARAVKEVKADFRVALSGTPVENHLGELWSIFDFLNPGYLGSLESFRQDYAAPIEKFRDAASIDRLRRITAPFIMRRLKSDRRIISAIRRTARRRDSGNWQEPPASAMICCGPATTSRSVRITCWTMCWPRRS